MAEKAIRIAREGGATYPETVVALLQPYEEQHGGGTHVYANMNGESVPFEAAVARTRDENPALHRLFQPGGKLDVRPLSAQQYRAIRETAPELLGLSPKRK